MEYCRKLWNIVENYGNNSSIGFMIENSIEKVCIGLQFKFKKK